MSLCGQNDLFGLPSVATYRAAFEVADIAIVREEFFPVDTEISSPSSPGCWNPTGYPVLGHGL